MEITPGITWIDEDLFIFSVRQQVRDLIEGWNQGTYERQNVLYDASKQKLRRINQDFFRVVGLLPNKENKILISIIPGIPDGMQRTGRLFVRIPRTTSMISKKTVASWSQERILSSALSGLMEGKSYLASGFDFAKGELVSYWRPPGTKDWEELHRLHEDSYEGFSAIAKDPAAPNHFFVSAHNGNDKRGLWSYDATKKTYTELIYRRSDVDVGGTLRHSNFLANPDEVTGVSWCKDKCHREFFNPEEAALYEQLESLFPEAFQVRINDRSRDGNTLIISTGGPTDPGTYYLIRKGKISKISGRKPYLEASQLANVEYISYPSRDGCKFSLPNDTAGARSVSQ